MGHSVILPVKPETGGKKAEGYVTPTADKQPQQMMVPPRRVLPIVFLPGIMGSNLRMNAARQERMKKGNNVAWRPDNAKESGKLILYSPSKRQLQLDPDTTEVDTYDTANNQTGDAKETADQRNSNVTIGDYYLNVKIDTPLLLDDPIANNDRRTKDQKARARGWGEIYFGSYRTLLEMCEMHLNAPYVAAGVLTPWWQSRIIGVAPASWQGMRQFKMAPLEEKTLCGVVTGCWFPVHAMGYNWLESNRTSGTKIAERISALIDRYNEQGYQCQQVILVTHSMGGLVARAVIHPAIGKINHKVLGIVHGVMPADGAAAAYKRMRCGFEPGAPQDLTSKVLGDTGKSVSAVLGNAPGGLELLPNRAYGNDWLQMRYKDAITLALPKQGDPYEEIYKRRDVWYGLLDEDRLNPARLQDRGIEKTCKLLDNAKAFHDALAGIYHNQSFAHYGSDFNHRTWKTVVWDLSHNVLATKMDAVETRIDDSRGTLDLLDRTGEAISAIPGDVTRKKGGAVALQAVLRGPAEEGDQTVPAHSANSQLASGKFKGIFRQTGYEHQNSYKDANALSCTIYSIIRIAQTMKWTK